MDVSIGAEVASLVLLANVFPYSWSEPYLETETQFYDDFDAVHIFSLSVRDRQAETVRTLPGRNIRVHRVPFKGHLFYAINLVTALHDRELYRELRALSRSRRLTIRSIVQLLVFFSRTHFEKRFIRKRLREDLPAEKQQNVVFYAYRYTYQPYLASLLSKPYDDTTLVSRAHGFDLYEERHRTNYIPLRHTTARVLDRIHPISRQGAEYLSAQVPESRSKISVRYLGTTDHGLAPVPAEDEATLRLVSCSNVVDIKRIDRLIDALALVERKVSWTHYGDGPLLAQMRKRAEERLAGKVDFEFAGAMSNSEVLAEYARVPYHALVNVSDSEGLPVAVMEALSFGIPVIATDVGGTSEAVKDGVNGGLVAPERGAVGVAGRIEWLASLTDDDYLTTRRSARRTWEELFNAASNYGTFVAELVRGSVESH